MGCASCSNNTAGLPAGCRNNGSCQTGCGNMLDVYDWLSNVYYIDDEVRHDLVEVRFKGTRKGFFRNSDYHSIEVGDKVVVEGTMGGNDIGTVSLVGPLVKTQMKKYRIPENSKEIRRLYRVATEADMDMYREAREREYTTMMKARLHARDLGLEMKISDVEFQGDNSKATFYYTAEGRVDFRELIKIYARNFKIKVEMRQIGLRQEAGRLGGIGSCGRELCCSTWLTDFNSVPTTAARYQNLFLNPLKLSGQCGRLKCCLNYELDTYVEALKEFPKGDVKFKTSKGVAKCVKTDILKRVLFFVVDGDPTNKMYPLELDEVKELLEAKKRGEETEIEDIEDLAIEEKPKVKEVAFSGDIIADDPDRFERKKKKKQRPNRKKRPSQKGNQSRPPKKSGNDPQQKREGNKPKKDNQKPQSDRRSKGGKPGNRRRPDNRKGNQSKSSPNNKPKSDD